LNRYAYLDEPEVQDKLLDFRESDFARVSFSLPQIHCSSCIYLLENLPQIEPAITDVKVNFSQKKACIVFKTDRFQLSMLASLLHYINYPPDFQSQKSKTNYQGKRMLMQLGLAGFFFGNTMLLAVPEYLDSSLALDPGIQRFFRYLMMLFSIPVLVYSGQDYFRNAYKSLRAGFLSIDLPIAIGASVLFMRSAYEVLSGMGSGYFDSLTGLIFFLLIGKWYQQKTYRNFSFDRDFRSFMPLAARILTTPGNWKNIAIDQLEAKDHIEVLHGEIIPADARLLSGHASIDYSYLTGESLPVQKESGALLYAGGKVQSDAIMLEVEQKPDRSYLASLWQNEAFTSERQKEHRQLSDRISQYFTPIILLIALLAGLYWAQQDLSKAAQVFTAVLIVACPCALALAEPFANGSLQRWFGRYGLYLKSSAVATRLASIHHIVFDKTGTLTHPEKIETEWRGKPLDSQQLEKLMAVVSHSRHPMALAIKQYLKKNGLRKRARPEQIEDRTGKGLEAVFEGEVYRLGSAKWLKLPPIPAGMSGSYLQINHTIMGYFTFKQANRAGLKTLMNQLRKPYRLSLLSGDHAHAQTAFQKIMGQESCLLFEAQPDSKLQYIKKLQEEGEKVLMLGDGLNDAGALKQSEVGISLCEKDVNYFPASDALLMAKSLPLLPKFLALSQRNQTVIQRAFTMSFSYNIIGLAFAATGYLSPLVAAILMPVSSVSVVLFTTLSNAYLSRKALGTLHSQIK